MSASIGKIAARFALCSVLTWTAVAISPAVARGSRIEDQVLASLNQARVDPQTYARSLTDYGRGFQGKIVTMPGTKILYRTSEGAAPVVEASSFLAAEMSQPRFERAEKLQAAAADHVSEQARSGRTGHAGRDGSSPSLRVIRRGGGGLVAEVITYGAFDAADVVRQLLVDDGVPDRGHRAILFTSRLRYAGVACGYHPKFRTMCVIDLAETPDGRPLRRLQIASLAG